MIVYENMMYPADENCCAKFNIICETYEDFVQFLDQFDLKADKGCATTKDGMVLKVFNKIVLIPKVHKELEIDKLEQILKTLHLYYDRYLHKGQIKDFATGKMCDTYNVIKLPLNDNIITFSCHEGSIGVEKELIQIEYYDEKNKKKIKLGNQTANDCLILINKINGYRHLDKDENGEIYKDVKEIK